MTAASASAVVDCVRQFAARDPRALTDQQLLDRFTLDQDEAAFAELVRRHGPMVLSVCRRVLRHDQDAEDAFQASFLVLARKAGSIRRRDAIAAWLHQVAHRLALRARAAGDRQPRQFTALTEECATPGPSRDPLGAELDEELQRLPERYRSAVVLCYLEGRTQIEVARILATTPDAVNSRLKRARDLLRRRLTQHGLTLSCVALVERLATSAARAALPAVLVQFTARVAREFAINQASTSGASALALALAKGALRGMFSTKLKLALSGLLVLLALLTSGALLVSSPPPGEKPARQQPEPAEDPAPPAEARAKPRRACIILWMNGGPSQLDTFDPKPGHLNGGLVRAINTKSKGVQISDHLPHLAKQTEHLAIIRSLTHREGDHRRATHLMQTGYEPNGVLAYPPLGCVLAKELGDGLTALPRYVNIGGEGDPGFLGPRYAPLRVGGKRDDAGAEFPLPAAEAFEALEKGKGEAMRKGVASAFDLKQEKAEVRDAYGRSPFGQGCLLARRLVEAGVPVVEVTLGGWDMHANVPAELPKLGAELDAGMAALLKDLHERKRLDSTLVLWMGEFGRTPKINMNMGRDHWPAGFSAVLAGCEIKGGRVIGKTSADGMTVEERPVTPPELLATVYKALGINLSSKNRTPGGQQVPLVEKGTRPVNELFALDLPMLSDRLGRLPSELLKVNQTDGEIVDLLFVATLARRPGAAEKERIVKHLKDAKNREEACRDALWALVNSKEFRLLHGLDMDLAKAREFQEKITRGWNRK
jgi:RNA polymerase sigma factor (sigma-70 family)